MGIALGSNIGPAVPAILGVAIVGFVVYLMRKRKRTSSKSRDT
jgi:LPXTG-motif cell wall-anchored protein